MGDDLPQAVRDELVTITRGGKEIVNVDFEPTGAATVAETKNPPDVSAPRSHVNQCVTCHSPSSGPMIASPDEACPGDHGSGVVYADLNNDGEQLKLSFGAGEPIRDFVYNDAPPWPTGAKGTGASIYLLAPGSVPDHADGTNWRASKVPGGTPL